MRRGEKGVTFPEGRFTQGRKKRVGGNGCKGFFPV